MSTSSMLTGPVAADDTNSEQCPGEHRGIARCGGEEEMSSRIDVVVGVISRPHGLRGQVAVELRTDEPGRRFFPGAQLNTDSGRVLTVSHVTWQRGRLMVTFEQ